MLQTFVSYVYLGSYTLYVSQVEKISLFFLLFYTNCTLRFDKTKCPSKGFELISYIVNTSLINTNDYRTDPYVQNAALILEHYILHIQ